MSQERPQVHGTIDRAEWDLVLRRLRADGFSPIESIKVTRAVLGVGLAEAKRIVHTSPVWADGLGAFDDVHDVAEAAVRSL